MKIIKTYDNEQIEITEEQNAKIEELSTNTEDKGVWLNDNYISFSSIKSISEKRDSYGQPYTDVTKLLLETGLTKKEFNRKEALEGLKKGLNNYLNSDKCPKNSNANKIIESIDIKLEKLKT